MCPSRYPHEYLRHGTAKLLTLFHPSTGTVRVKGVQSCPNAVLHAWQAPVADDSGQPATNMTESVQRILIPSRTRQVHARTS